MIPTTQSTPPTDSSLTGTPAVRHAPEDFLTITADGRAEIRMNDRRTAQKMKELCELVGPYNFRALLCRAINGAVNNEIRRVHPKKIACRAAREAGRQRMETAEKERRIAEKEWAPGNLIAFPSGVVHVGICVTQ